MNITTDPSRIQEIKNSIAEGRLILRSGKFHGRKMSIEELGAVRRSVFNAQAKIGENLIINNRKKEYTIEDVTPAGFGV